MRLSKIQRKYTRFAIKFLLVLPGIPFVLFTLGYLGYLFWPHDVSDITNLKLSKNAQHLTISAHGVKDSSESWSDKLQQLMARQLVNLEQQNISLSWQPYSDNPLTCSVLAKRIGQQLGERIIKETQITSIHAIAHSCGSFVIYGLCQQIKENSQTIKIQTSYLDPVSVYGGFLWDYGVDNFGSCADFSDAYIDTGDTVPGSNQALLNAHTFDVTKLRIKNQINVPPHIWPTQYYLQALDKGEVPLLVNDSEAGDKFKAGKMTVVEE